MPADRSSAGGAEDAAAAVRPEDLAGCSPVWRPKDAGGWLAAVDDGHVDRQVPELSLKKTKVDSGGVSAHARLDSVPIWALAQRQPQPDAAPERRPQDRFKGCFELPGSAAVRPAGPQR